MCELYGVPRVLSGMRSTPRGGAGAQGGRWAVSSVWACARAPNGYCRTVGASCVRARTGPKRGFPWSNLHKMIVPLREPPPSILNLLYIKLLK